MCQSHTGRLAGLWFLPKPAFGLNTNDDDIYIYMAIRYCDDEFNELLYNSGLKYNKNDSKA